MTADAFGSFVKDLLLLRENQGRAPFVLFLGNGVVPEIHAALVGKVLENHEPPATGQPVTFEAEHAFREVWQLQPDTVRNALFWSALDIVKKEFSEQFRRAVEGFGHLAQLVKEGFFDIIVTTRADWLLENALQRVLDFQEWRVHRVGVRPAREIAAHVAPGPRRIVSVVKLRGDAVDGVYLQGDEKTEDLAAITEVLFSRPMLLVGYDDGADQDLWPALRHSCAPLYFAAVAAPHPHLTRALQHARPRFITGDTARFDELFRRLAATVIGGPGKSAAVKMLVDSGTPLSRLPGEKLDEFIKNPVGRTEDIVEVLHTFHRTEATSGSAFVSFPKRVIITLSIDDRMREVAFRGEGHLEDSGAAELAAPLDVDGYTRSVRFLEQDLERACGGSKAGREAWRSRQESEGKRLHGDLVRPIPELMSLLDTAHGVTLDHGELMVCFDGSRDLLAMPCEFLQDEHGPWAVRYPIYRTVQNVAVKGPGFCTLVDQLQARREPLRVLIVGAEPVPSGGVAEYVAQLRQALELRAAQLLFSLVPETLVVPATEQARLQDRLLAGGYHVLCHVGRGARVDAEAGADSAIGSPPQIWNEQQIYEVLRKASPQLVFFDGGVAVRAGEPALHDRGLLGALDAAVQAGVPVVLGHRWDVDHAARFGQVFLEKLLETRSPPLAVFHARRAVWDADRLDATWASGILVAQQVD